MMNRGDMVSEAVSSILATVGPNNPDSPAMLAKLRRGVGKSLSDSPESWSVVLSNIPDDLSMKGRDYACPTNAESAIFIAVTLYALHQQGKTDWMNEAGVSFGSAMHRIAPWSNETAIKTFTRRFNAVITSQSLDELSYHARGMVQLMRSNAPAVGFDYPRFAKDLYYFQNSETKRNVVLRWGQDFYRREAKD